MDLYASAALSGLGYALTQERDTLHRNEARQAPGVGPDPRDMPSMQNIYASDHNSAVRADERSRGTGMWNAAQNPYQTGVVPRPAYADMFASPNGNSGANGSAGAQVQTMSGKSVSREEFTHNNMQPYFKGTARQNTDIDANSTLLSNYTGTNNVYQKKKEVECFFEPTGGMGNVCGFLENKDDFYLSRVVAPKSRNHEFPIEQVRVGKGLGQGFTDAPSGGFQQSSTLDFVRPKNVDELRVATNPRVTYKLPFQGPAAGIARRGIQAPVDKNRPDTFFEQCQDQLLKTTGAITRETSRPVQDVKATARVDSHTEYAGTATAGGKPGQGASYDYGKGSVMVFNNSRDLTGSHTIISNLTSAVKSIIAPLLDVFRHTPKEFTIDAPREFGNMHAQIPSKATIYDPVNHMMRTTIKETTVHDTTVNNLKGNTKGPMANLDEAKTTVRQTMPVEDVVRNVAAHTYNVTVYNVDEVARTTVRQTTAKSGSMYGFIGGKAQDSAGAYSVIDVDMPNTQKQFVSDYEYEGIAGSKADFRPMSDEAERNAEIDGTRDAINKAAGYTPNGGGGYTGQDPATIDMEVKRLASDSLATRETANMSPKQITARAIEDCEVTKRGDFLNGGADRLDGATLASLRSNPFNIGINPVTM